MQIDVLPIEYFYDREVLVEKVSIPPDVKKGETVNINVVIRASEPTTRDAPDLPEGRQLPRPRPRQREARSRSSSSAGSTSSTLKQLITEPNFYTFTAEFIPDKDSGDRRAINNVGRGVHPRPGHGAGPPDRGDRAASTPSWSRPSARRRSRSRRWSPPGSTARGGVGGDPLPTDLGAAPAVRHGDPRQRPQGRVHRGAAPAPRVATSTTWAPA